MRRRGSRRLRRPPEISLPFVFLERHGHRTSSVSQQDTALSGKQLKSASGKFRN
jgi:hypothetical protein